VGLSQEVTVREVEGVAVVEVGESALSHPFKQSVTDPVGLLLAKGKKKLLLDLSNVERCDNTGIAQLVKAFASARERGGKLILLTDPSSKIQEYLVITKLTTLFEIFHDQAEAIRSFQPD
jgi:anti-sigma B factor antagonist